MNVRLQLNLTASSDRAAEDALAWVLEEVRLGRIQSHKFTERYRVNFLLAPDEVPETQKSAIRMVE